MKKLFFTAGFLFIAVYLGSIWTRTLFIPDEVRYAEIAREMIASKNWIKPVFCGIDYFEKPVMGHWGNAVSMSIFGECKGAVRFMPALCTLLAALLTALMVRRSFSVRKEECTWEEPLAAMLWYLSFGLVFAVGTFGVLDAQLSLFTTAMLCAFFHAVTEKSPGRTVTFLALAGVAAGCAFLTKGFVGPALCGAAAAAFLIWEKEWRKLFTYWIIPLLFATATVWPWATAIHREAPDFWHYFIVVEHFERAVKDNAGQHPQPFYFFIVLILPVLLPGTVFTGALYAGLKGRFKDVFSGDKLLKLSLCAVVIPLLMLSAVSGKLLTYILPCCAPAAIIFSSGISSYFKRSGNSLKCWTIPLNILFYFAMTAGILMLLWQKLIAWKLFPAGFALYSDTTSYLIAGAALLAAAVIWKNSVLPDKTPVQRQSAFFIGTAVIMASVPFAIPLLRMPRIAPEAVVKKHLLPRLNNPDTVIIADKNLFPVICWELKRNDIFMQGSMGELEYGLTKTKSGKGRHLSDSEITGLIKSGRHVVVAVTNHKRLGNIPSPQIKIQYPKARLTIAEYNKK